MISNNQPTCDWITPDWPAPENIHACSTTRSGGVSKNQYATLNLANHVGDHSEDVLENRKRLREQLRLPVDPTWIEQVHGCHIVQVDQVDSLVKADASFTRTSQSICAVMTADCLPILLCDKKGQFIAAIHAGWRGLAQGIIEKTVNLANANNLLAWLGPAIGPTCFEVGIDVYNQFVLHSPALNQVFRPHQNKKWLADLYLLAKMKLSAVGVKQIYGGQFCTYSDPQRFFSYRRDGETGRMATLIWRSY
ncbi:MAG: peptidoglycan editing factor PgeF [Methylococcaceae bacterium]